MADSVQSKADFLNQVTRSLMAVIFTLTVSTAFLWGVIRDNIRIAAAFIGVIVIAIGWWYGQQNDRKRATDSPAGGTNGTTTPPAPTP